MPDDPLTTVQVKVSTRERIRFLANEDKRSMTAEVDWLVEQELMERHGTIELPESNLPVAK
jgi:hypothetical protein